MRYMNYVANKLCRTAEFQVPSVEDAIAIALDRMPGSFRQRFLGDYRLRSQVLSEVLTMESVRQAAMIIPELVEVINIPEGFETTNYIFRGSSYGNSVAIRKDTGKEAAEIDGLIAIGKTKHLGRRCMDWSPYIVEVKMSRYGYLSHSEETDGAWTDLTHIVKHPRSIKAIDPVLELFQEMYDRGEISNRPRKVGVIVAMPKDQYNLAVGGNQHRFWKQGGHIIRIPFDLGIYTHLMQSLDESLD